MGERSTRTVEDRLIVTSGSKVCPARASCDIQPGEKYSAYVRRHAREHQLGEFDVLEDAERNLALWCFYYFHKFVYGNVTLTPQPFWEIHAFIWESEWNEDDLEERVPLQKRTFKPIPDAGDRRPGDVRQMKQAELPRQCEKTSTGSNAHSIARSVHEYYVNDLRTFPIMIRSETALNARDSLSKIRAKAKGGKHIKRLFGVKLLKCNKCGDAAHISLLAEERCPSCGDTKKIRVQTMALIDPTRGAGGTGRDSVTFRWATNTAEVGQSVRAAANLLANSVDDDGDDDEGIPLTDDEEYTPDIEGEGAVYSVRAVGLKTALTGQRPRVYILDDIQSEDNSDTHEKRMKIEARFDEAKRQLEFGGELFVFNTRKYVNDFAGSIGKEPLRSQFHTLHRRVYWPTSEPDDPPYVVAGMRYYYPVKGNGEPALDAAEVERLEKQMLERKFSAEYLNDPTDEKRALFKRADFKIHNVDDPSEWVQIPIEIRFGLGRALSSEERYDLASKNLRIQAFNFWDPSGKDEQSKRGDDTFGVALRYDRYGGIWITGLAAGQWGTTRTFNEVERLDSWNRPEWSDYEMGVDEKSCKAAFQKWTRDRADETGVTPMLAMRWSHMPKSSKTGRMEKLETWTSAGNFHILSSAGLGDSGIIEKYIGQFLALGRNADHDDGPDATSRCVTYFRQTDYQEPPKPEDTDGAPYTLTGGVPWNALKGLAASKTSGKLWGEVNS